MSTPKIMSMDWKALGYNVKWQDGMKVWEKDQESGIMAEWSKATDC